MIIFLFLFTARDLEFYISIYRLLSRLSYFYLPQRISRLRFLFTAADLASIFSIYRGESCVSEYSLSWRIRVISTI